MTQVVPDRALVRALLQEQHPDLAGLSLTEVEGGWDNRQWRLGDQLAVRLPVSDRAPGLLQKEQDWLPTLATGLPLPVPVPLRQGAPSELFDRAWAIVRWVEGQPADRAPVTSTGAATVLARFLDALHRPAPVDAPVNPPRGLPLDQAGPVDGWFELIADHPYRHRLRDLWTAAVGAPAWTGPPLWLHGDLHPANVVTRAGCLAGVLDFGDLCAGDPAWDASAAWVLLPRGDAEPFFAAYPHTDDALVTRARGWAVLRALALIQVGQNGRHRLPGGKPTWEPAGYAALERVLDH
ncbi:aminoglycoside phosphotransferase family protein [Ruania albidiflava]|uniref:aminoglycoside phosphotransferase family protein n=1 Tax=Ruania albidiflava TaxID=366586 RepID=UPI0003B66C3C|nr:aminoglycoside phosphotransferase family protein [Ruania albidiflava]